ncbi:MAG TPA: TolC family protein [Planctomycetota bacterium]|nr:TolC family protein [Planctomycetota bacterium]OQC20251.1 MAG: Cobalt-zinc-cadmium resistance protein CzcC precursor [Planctomycetes bacterium ADurb.Bin069]HNR99225.1 TolC family protein [Planctomycetota bacterium]HNU27097.1 TolC family protein [Planctomycetota bacterium]HOE30638.1 TolC family protein [Planctomycetota bacterium]
MRILCVFCAAAGIMGCAGGAVGAGAVGDEGPSRRSYEAALSSPPVAMEEPAGVLSASEAVALALGANPDLTSSVWEARAAEGRADQAGARPNPVAEIELEEFGADRPGLSRAELTALLSQEIELGGKRALRMEAAAGEQAAAGWDYETQRREVRRRVACAFARVLAAQECLELADEGVTIAEGTRDAIARAVQAGAAAALEEASARMALASARSELFAAQEEVGLARAALAALWGGTEAKFTRAEGVLKIDAAPEPFETLRARLDRHPEMRRAEAEVGALESLRELERAQRIPNVTLSAGYRRLEAENVDTFVAGIGVPLPVFDRNRGRIREAEARLAGAEAQRAARAQALVRALARAVAALRVAGEKRDAYERDILPAAEAALEAAREAYAQRMQGCRDLLTAEDKLLRARREHVAALLQVAEAWADIEYLAGTPPAASAKGE